MKITDLQEMHSFARLLWFSKSYLHCHWTSRDERIRFPQGKSLHSFPSRSRPIIRKATPRERCMYSHLLYTLSNVPVLHSLNLVHTDLKPENILLVSNDSFEVKCASVSARSLNQTNLQRGQKTKKLLSNTEIRLIDFGSATFNDEYHSNLVSTRHYRAPEIILGKHLP